MKRGTRCIVQTINLSDPKTCVRSTLGQSPNQKPIADAVDSPPRSNHVNDYWIPRPVTVKVYTRKDAQKKCPLKPHERPQKLQLSTNQKISAGLIFLVKAVITASLINWTRSKGVWGTNTETEDLYRRMMSTINPAPLRQPNADDVHSPHLEGIKYSILEAYNHALLKVMDMIVGVPLEMHRRLRKVLSSCEEIKETNTSSKQYDEKRQREYSL